jgi:hypothetical protein
LCSRYGGFFFCWENQSVYIDLEVVEMEGKVKNANCVGVCKKAMETAGIECPGWDMSTWDHEDIGKCVVAIKNILRYGVPCQKERCPVGHDYESETYITALCGDIGGFAGDR